MRILKNFFKRSISLAIIAVFLASCGISEKVKDFHKPVDLRNEPLDPDKRARRNIEQGRGISIGNLGDKKTTYEFSTSNPLWRASLEIIDFMPLTTVDYSGGIIITDWYTDSSNSKDSIKITLRFLSNEVRSDSIKVIVHNKKCGTNENCAINEIDSKIKFELQKSILTKAAQIELNAKKPKKKN